MEVFVWQFISSNIFFKKKYKNKEVDYVRKNIFDSICTVVVIQIVCLFLSVFYALLITKSSMGMLNLYPSRPAIFKHITWYLTPFVLYKIVDLFFCMYMWRWSPWMTHSVPCVLFLHYLLPSVVGFVTHVTTTIEGWALHGISVGYIRIVTLIL